MLNNSLDHAAMVVEHLFRDAYKRVDILSHNLNPTVYGRLRVIRPADDFLQKRGRSLRILLEQGDTRRPGSHPFLDVCRDFPDKVEVRIVPDSFQERYKTHVVVTDAHSYRVELDKSKIDAIVAFGEPKGATHLSRFFNWVWRQSESGTISLSEERAA